MTTSADRCIPDPPRSGVAKVSRVRPTVHGRAYLDVLEDNRRLRAALARGPRTNWWLQGPIFLCGALGVLLPQDPATALLGYSIGLAGQPFFLRAAWLARQTGAFYLGFILCAAFAAGIARNL